MNYLSIPSMTELAAFKIALEVWYKAFHMETKSTTEIELFSTTLTLRYANHANKLVDEMVGEVPHTLLPTIKKQICIITEELCNFMEHYHERITDVHYNGSYILRLIPDIVWSTNRTIDYMQTAVNLLNGTKLSKNERFKLMCQYCLKDDILKFIFTKGIDFDVGEYPMVQYWIDALNGDPTESIYSMGLMSNDYVAIDYLWNNLSLKDQLLSVRDCHSSYVLIKWISKLRKEDLRKVFSTKTRFITDIFLHHWAYDSFIHRMWTLIKDFITGEQYVQILHCIKRNSNERVSGHFGTANLLMEIWDDTPQKLKKCAFNFEDGHIIYDLCGFFTSDNSDSEDGENTGNATIKRRKTNSRLLRSVLSDMDDEFKKEFWSKILTKDELPYDI